MKIIYSLGLLAFLGLCAPAQVANPADAQAKAIFDATGFQGGLVLQVGCQDGRLATALARSESVFVHALVADEAAAATARAFADTQKKSDRVTFEVQASTCLPLVDNLANLVVAEDLGRISPKEIMRVLAPLGVAYFKQDGAWKKEVKPRPAEYDDWTHYLHGPDGHVMSKDTAVGPPMHLQWVGDPEHAKSHTYLTTMNVMVAGGGRVFYIADETAKALPASLPSRWALFARDAFNGLVLWKRPIAQWQPSYLKDRNCYPADLHRRLVAGDKAVFCTLDIYGPVLALDPVTGATLLTYPNTERAEEIVYDAGTLYVVVNNAEPKALDRRAMAYDHVEPQAKRIMAFRPERGELLWTKSDAETHGLMAMTLASKNKRLFFENPREVVCLNAADGKVLWKTPRPTDYNRPGWSAPNLTVLDDVVISADRQSGPGQKVGKDQFAAGGFSTGNMVAMSIQTGKQLWTAPCAEGGRAPADVFSVGGKVWYGENLERTAQDYRSIRDVNSGKLLVESPLSADWPTMHHHRCYQDKATPNFILGGRTGIEFIDLKTGAIQPHNWVRGSCKYGIMPSYGLIYAPPDQCGCYIESRLTGFNAMAPKRPSDAQPAEAGARFVQGSAYAAGSNVKSETATSPEDWPTYRADAARSGCTKTRVPADLKSAWRTSLGGRLTQPVVSDGTLFVASIDDHALYLINAATGEIKKRFLAGGRIDSPPTIANKLAIFGCADGWIYALRCGDGELAWRFRAAPDDQKLVAHGQVESVWPVHGSVLVQDGFVYACAGRNSYLDGGVRLVKLELGTGKLNLEKTFYSRDPKTGKSIELYPSFLANTKDKLARMEMPGVLPDVPSSDGKRIWLRAVTFNTQLAIQHEFPDHLFSSVGLLDDSWWELSYWIYGPHCYSGRSGIDHAKGLSPSARLMVVDTDKIYGYQDETFSKAGLMAMSKKPVAKTALTKKKQVRSFLSSEWRCDIELYPQGIALADKTLFIAGPPSFDEAKTRLYLAAARTDDYKLPPVLQDAQDAFDGKKGGLLWAFNAADGKKTAAWKFDSVPVFDGLIAANNRLYLSCKDGAVVCFGSAK